MKSDYSLEYRNKKCRIPKAGYDILIEDMMINPDDVIKEAIDLFISSGLEFNQIHLYVSVKTNGAHIINLMAID